MSTIPIYYDIPIMVFLVLTFYTIFELKKAKTQLGKSPVADSFSWFISATIFLFLWGAIHLYDDLVVPPGNLKVFLHYMLSHNFLLIALVFIAIAAKKTQKFIYSWSDG